MVRSTLSKEAVMEDMCAPRVTFHGTPVRYVGSIVRHGFKLPGTLVDGEVVASPRSRIVFKRGIYSSQAAFYAMSYACGENRKTPLGEIHAIRLFVCATVMGRTYRGGCELSNVHGPLVDGFDSHFDGRFEYIVYDERAMLPCYVVHLDLGSEEAKRALEEAQENASEFLARQNYEKKVHPKLAKALGTKSPGDIKREKNAKKTAAMKYFPYGFGTATGTNFVIEEIGRVSDDEEEYGEWQEDKHVYIHENAEDGAGDLDGYYDDLDENGQLVRRKRGLFLDQYRGAVRAPTMVKQAVISEDSD
jgi:hypothetical protein